MNTTMPSSTKNIRFSIVKTPRRPQTKKIHVISLSNLASNNNTHLPHINVQGECHETTHQIHATQHNKTSRKRKAKFKHFVPNNSSQKTRAHLLKLNITELEKMSNVGLQSMLEILRGSVIGNDSNLFDGLCS
jgi:hypothetical protein